jgi:hypothetical protein
MIITNRIIPEFLSSCAGFCLLILASGEIDHHLNAQSNPKFKVSKTMVLKAKSESLSLVREKHIQERIIELKSSQSEERSQASWFLGQIQSSQSLVALLEGAKSEADPIVIHNMFDSVSQLLFLDLFDPNDEAQEPEEQKRKLARIKLELGNEGYTARIIKVYDRAKGIGREAKSMFLVALTERYDPSLSQLLLRIGSEESDADIRDLMDKTLLIWTGFDLATQRREEISNHLEKKNAFSRTEIIPRYRAYLEKKGLFGVADNLSLAVSATGTLTQETQRAVALRVALILSENDPHSNAEKP